MREKRDGRELARDQLALQAALVSRVTKELSLDRRICALWQEGSGGRGTADSLSDIDLTIIMAPGAKAWMLADRMELVSRFGAVSLHSDSPHNAPKDGAQTNALYDLQPLPIYIDWNWWPFLSERPSDVRVLFEQDPSQFVTGRDYVTVANEWERGSALVPARDRMALFALAMAPIIAKMALRSDESNARRMFGVIGEPAPASMALAPVLDALDALVDRLGHAQSPEAVATVRRYLWTARRYGPSLGEFSA